MAFTPPKPLDVGELIANSNEDVYTVGTNLRTIISAATAKNTTTTAATLTIWLGATATDATERTKMTLGSEESVILADIIGQSLNAAEKIIMVSDTNDVISVRITGSEYTV